MVKKNISTALETFTPTGATLERLEKFLAAKQISKIRKTVESINKIDVAEWMEKLSFEDQIFFLRSLDNITASEIFNNLNDKSVTLLIEKITASQTKQLIEPLYSDDVLELIEDLPSNLVTKILASSSKDQRKDINYILNYQEGTVGYEMNVDFVVVKIDEYVSDLVKNLSEPIRKIPEEFSSYYVVDDNNVLIGYVQAQSLLKLSAKDRTQRISSIMETDVISVRASDDTETAAAKIRKYSLAQLPVVDNQNKLVGVLNSTEVIQLIQEEYSDDINKQAGIIQDSDLKYFEISVFRTYLGRMPWLFITVIISMISQIIFTNFLQQWGPETGKDLLRLIISFLPFILTIVGNIALQSTAIIVKSLILKEIRKQNYWRVIFKELKVVMLIFLTMVVLNIPRIFIVDLLTDNNKISSEGYVKEFFGSVFLISVIIFFAVFLSIFFSAALPIFTSMVGLDPTLMSSPLLTTIIDLLVSSIVIGFGYWFNNLEFFINIFGM